jgi:hypothetical protein
MHEELPTKLHKIGEHGVGKHVLVFISDTVASEHLPFKGSVSSKWKVHYFHVNLQDNYSEIYKKLVNSLNYYHYADTLVFDFPVFLLFLHVIERITLAHSHINKIIIFNPLAADTTIMQKAGSIFNPKKYTNILDHKVMLPKGFLKKFKETFEKLHFIHADTVSVVSMENKNIGLKLAARIKNSRLETCSDYPNAIELILKEFT